MMEPQSALGWEIISFPLPVQQEGSLKAGEDMLGSVCLQGEAEQRCHKDKAHLNKFQD